MTHDRRVGDIALSVGIDRLAGEVSDLRTTVDKDRRARRRFAILVAAVGIGYGLLYLRVSNVSASNHTGVRILIECTTPGNPEAANRDDRVHECYDAAQANQQRAVTQIVDANHNGIPDTAEILSQLGKTSTPTR